MNLQPRARLHQRTWSALQAHPWAYPALESAHIVGIGLLLGNLVLLELRVFGRGAALPRRPDREWAVELAPLTRLAAWQVPEIKPGERLELIGFTFKDEHGEAVLRAEYLFLDGKIYGMRSSPA